MPAASSQRAPVHCLAVSVTSHRSALITQVPLGINPDWHGRSVWRTTGAFLGQLLGNALFEEILFRGVLFQQIRLHLLRRGNAPAKALVIALAVSQTLFALIHVPLRVSSGMALTALPGELALLFTLGVLLALLYWRTANLYVVVGIHALSNTPVPIVEERIDLSTYGVITAVASLAVMLAWPQAPLKIGANTLAKQGRRGRRPYVLPPEE